MITFAVFSENVSATDACIDQLPLNQCWKTQDIIDKRIDVYAQKALLEMFSNGGNDSADASAIICAIKREQLGGIFLPDQKVPALRAKAEGSGWWKILNGRESVCYKTIAANNPIIVFDKKIKSDVNRTIKAIVTAWNDCKIPSSGRRCYTQTIGAGTEREIECVLDRDCVEKYHSKDYECDQINRVCVYKFGMEVTPRPCTGQGECKMDWDCASKNCIRPDKNKCGRCRSLNPERHSKKVCADGEEWGACLVNLFYYICEKKIDDGARNEAKNNLKHVLETKKAEIAKQYKSKIVEFTVSGNVSSRVSRVVEKEYDTGRGDGRGGQTLRMKQVRIKNRECVTLGYEIH